MDFLTGMCFESPALQGVKLHCIIAPPKLVVSKGHFGRPITGARIVAANTTAKQTISAAITDGT
jgi:hypothetical protein